MHRASLLSVFVVSSACVPPRAMQPLAGTYAVWLCDSACAVSDTAAAPVAGYLVLSEAAIPPESFANGTLGKSLFLRTNNPIPNACFTLEQRRRDALFAGIIPAAVTTWSRRGDSLSVLLYASPDAFYTLDAIVKDGYLLGVGREAGFIGASFDEQRGPVHGIRIGSVDLTRCSRDRGRTSRQ